MDISHMTPKVYAKEQAKRILRVNNPSPAHAPSQKKRNPDAISKRVRNITSMPAYTPRVRAPNEALPPQIDKMAGTYDGRELLPYEGRPGAMDAFALPSKGTGV